LIPMADPRTPRSLPKIRQATGGPQTQVLPGIGSVAPAGQDTSTFIARFTGGKAFLGYNDLTDPMVKTQQTTAVTYTLGFYPDSALLDSKRHSLKVEVERKGAELSYRRDYAATPEPPERRIPEQVEITEAIWSAVDSTGIGIRASAERVEQPQAGLVAVTVTIAGGDVTLQPGEGDWSGALALVYEQRSADGKDMGRISETLDLKYDEEHRAKLPADGIAYKKLVRPAPDAAQIRVVVYDRGSGRVGSVVVRW
jgi:hypothetical protein